MSEELKAKLLALVDEAFAAGVEEGKKQGDVGVAVAAALATEKGRVSGVLKDILAVEEADLHAKIEAALA